MDTYLKEFREKAVNMTQQEFSERIGVAQNTLSRWEKDPDTLSIKQLRMIADVFGVSEQDILHPTNLAKRNEPWKPNLDTAIKLKAKLNKIEEETNLTKIVLSKNSDAENSLYDSYGEKKLNVLNSIYKEGRKPSLALTGPSDAGKSTIINYMLGNNILETKWTPTTSAGTKLVHISEKPEYMGENDVAVFQSDFNEGMVGIEELRDQEYFDNHLVEMGDKNLIDDYATHDGEKFESIKKHRSSLFTVVVYLDSPILELSEIWDIPGTEANDSDDLSDDFVAAASLKGADILIHVTPATAILHHAQMAQLKSDIYKLKNYDMLSADIEPFENLFIVASQANFVLKDPDNNDLMANLKKRINSIVFDENYWDDIENKLPASIRSQQPKYSVADIEKRAFMFEKYDADINEPFKKAVLRLLEKISQYSIETVDHTAKETKSKFNKGIDEELQKFDKMLIDAEKAEHDYQDFLKNKPRYLEQNEEMYRLMNEGADKYKQKTNDEITDYLNDQIDIDNIQALIKKKDFGKNKEGREKFITWFQDTMNRKANNIVKDNAEKYGNEINAKLEYYQKINLDLKVNGFNYAATFLAALSSVATYGAFSLYFASLGNLGGYILVSQAVSVLAGWGISVGGTASAITAISAIGGPITIVIAIALVVAVLVRTIAGGSWQKSFAKQMHKQFNKPMKNSKQPSYDGKTYKEIVLKSTNDFWYETKSSINLEMFNEKIVKQEEELKQLASMAPESIKKLMVIMKELLF
ncbi:helix-turn-helix domain-containing protein [Enterococcus xiangfangensis]|uniref:Helix-turn-helix domain-containing protein n=1 Tax=Enterococcus xiangfangensis TaxID=1296537 RepID=A0ABU3F9A0_9ENTE|nr:helix-turn-helix domain-containing protein [Enterococcus xiangfangensis]MDT2759258.1 helix-turn-helix domain-containing protein [Enterococcus xiangfangensis]